MSRSRQGGGGESRSLTRIFWLTHPILFSAFPVLFLLSHNFSELDLNQLWWPLGVSALAAGVLFLVSQLFFRCVHKAGIATSVFVLLFLLYGHVFEGFESRGSYLASYRHRQFLPLAFLVWGYVVFFLRRARFRVEPISKSLSVVALALVLLNVGSLAGTIATTKAPKLARDTAGVVRAKTFPPAPREPTGEMPDIYYVILDEFASLETAEDVYGYQNEELALFLRDKGFFIAERSESRYSSTWDALDAVLNMEYVDSREPVKSGFPRILDSAVSRHLKDKGYLFVYNSDQKLHRGTSENPSAHVDFQDLAAKGSVTTTNLSPFQVMLLKTSALRPFYDKLVRDGLLRRRGELAKLSAFRQAISLPSPKFVVSHHLISHAPFMFGENGETVDIRNHRDWSKKEFYLGTYKYCSRRVIELIEDLFSKALRPFVLIVQSDHGPRAGQADVHAKVLPSALGEWRKVFNAFYFPPNYQPEIALDVAPVNTFRMVFREIFGEDFADLPH